MTYNCKFEPGPAFEEILARSVRTIQIFEFTMGSYQPTMIFEGNVDDIRYWTQDGEE